MSSEKTAPGAETTALDGQTTAPGAEPLQYDEGYGPKVGVGPHPQPWPDDSRYDPELLAHGDRRNVVDHYRYWTREAIVADLDTRRHDFHVAVENWGHDFNPVYGRGVEPLASLS